MDKQWLNENILFSDDIEKESLENIESVALVDFNELSKSMSE